MGKTSFSYGHKTCALCANYIGPRGILEQQHLRYFLDTNAQGRCRPKNCSRRATHTACEKFDPIPGFEEY